MADFDLIVIGGGPAGYIGAIRASQLGKKVAIVEREKVLGGTCLRVGCIPSKAMLESSHIYHNAVKGSADRGVIIKGVELDLPAMMDQKSKVVQAFTGGLDGLMKKNKITRFFGQGRITAPGQVAVEGDSPETLKAPAILIATGSQPSTLPNLVLDGELIGSSTEALSYDKVPEHLVVIGAGVIGLELGSVWRRLGSKVTVLEYLDRILPGMDLEIANEALKSFKKQGIEFKLSTKVLGATSNGKTCTVEIDGADSISADRVLVAVGRKPNTEGLGLEAVGVTLNPRGFVTVNQSYQTNVPGIFAVGDVVGGQMLAHKAEEEAVAFVEQLYTGYGHVNYSAIPGVVYTDPEIGSVGYSEEQLKELGIPYRKGAFPFAANGRARANGTPDGKCKVLAHKDSDKILGVHIIGPSAGELIAQAVSAIEFGATSEDLARCSFAHPTLAEVLKEACLAVDGRTLNM